MKKDKNIFFHGQPPSPTNSALRDYNYKQSLRACGAAGLIKNTFLSFFINLCLQLSFSSFSYADVLPPQVCHQDNCVTVEVVSKQADLERGLMFRTSLGADKGMLFVFNTDDIQQFWMKNMHFDLDMLWISADDHIIYIGQHIPACTKDPCPVYSPNKPARYVLEINSGYTSSHSWKVGDKLNFKGI